jgi:hypothetical protein
VWRVSIPNFDVYGATSLFTTVGDLLKWEANFDRPLVGDRALFDQMQTPTRLTNGDASAYGLGLSIGAYRGARLVEHNGADAGYRSYAGRFPDHGLAIAVLCNAATANTTALARGVADAYLGTALAPVAAPAQPPPAAAVPPAAVQRRAGVYIQPTTQQFVELTFRDGQLILGRTTGPQLIPLAENRFRAAGQPLELVFANGDQAGFDRRLIAGGRPLPFEWRQPAIVSAPVLAAYVGEYYSEEVDARYRVTASDSGLSLRTGTSDPREARPLFLDGFDWGGDTLQFLRTGTQVTGFEVTSSRMRRVRFEKVPPRR